LNLILAERHKALANDALRARVEEIANVVPIGYRIHLVTSGTGLSPDSRVKLDTFIANLKAPSDDFCTWELEDIHRLQDTFYQRTLPTVEDVYEFNLTHKPHQVRSANHDCTCLTSPEKTWRDCT